MILRTDVTLFVTDDERTLEHFGNEQLMAEHNGQTYRLSIDRTTPFPFYELYREYKEGLRRLHERLYATSDLDKMKAYINTKL